MMMNMSIEHERDELMSDATLICSKLIFFFFFLMPYRPSDMSQIY